MNRRRATDWQENSPWRLGFESYVEWFKWVWDEFKKRFPEEIDCLREIHRRCVEVGKALCPRCGTAANSEEIEGRYLTCKKCRTQYWFTAQTAFHNIRQPKAWLAAIWFFEHGVVMSSLKFSQLLEIAYATAHDLFKKITKVVRDNMPEDSLDIPTAELAEVVQKRSCATPCWEHPTAEEKHFDESAANAKPNEMWANAYGALAELEREVIDLLAEPLTFSELLNRVDISCSELGSLLTELELQELVIRTKGELYARNMGGARMLPAANIKPGEVQSAQGGAQTGVSTGRQSVAKTTIQGLIDFIRGFYQGVSRRYISHYAAAFGCYVRPQHWRDGKLLRRIIQVHSEAELVEHNYVSPLTIKVTPLPLPPP